MAPMELAELVERTAAFGPVSFLVTVGEEGAPHLVSVIPEWRDDELVAPAGSRTSGNVVAHGRATLLWPAGSGGDYCLIVDGTARVGDAGVAVRPTRAVLHRWRRAMQACRRASPSCSCVC